MRHPGVGALVLLVVLAAVQITLGALILTRYLVDEDSLPVWLAVLHLVMGISIGVGALRGLRRLRPRPVPPITPEQSKLD